MQSYTQNVGYRVMIKAQGVRSKGIKAALGSLGNCKAGSIFLTQGFSREQSEVPVLLEVKMQWEQLHKTATYDFVV